MRRLELKKNQDLRGKLENMKKALELFTNRSKGLDVILGRESSKHDQSVGIPIIIIKSWSANIFKGTIWLWYGEASRVNNAKVAFTPRKIAKDES